MEITAEMIDRAVTKAADIGLVPRVGTVDMLVDIQDKITEILEAALNE